MIAFTVPGQAVPKGRPRFAKKGRRVMVFTPTTTQEFEKRVRAFAMEAGARKLDGDLGLTVRFFVKDHRRRDLDNLLKGVKDALNGIAWEDDCQVASCFMDKKVDDNPRTEVAVWRLT